MESFLSNVKDCFGKCFDDKPSVNVQITIRNDREYYCESRPRHCRPSFLSKLKRKRSLSVG